MKKSQQSNPTKTVVAATSSKKSRVSLPENFDGNRRDFRGFINQVNLIFRCAEWLIRQKPSILPLLALSLLETLSVSSIQLLSARLVIHPNSSLGRRLLALWPVFLDRRMKQSWLPTKLDICVKTIGLYCRILLIFTLLPPIKNGTTLFCSISTKWGWAKQSTECCWIVTNLKNLQKWMHSPTNVTPPFLLWSKSSSPLTYK